MLLTRNCLVPFYGSLTGVVDKTLHGHLKRSRCKYGVSGLISTRLSDYLVSTTAGQLTYSSGPHTPKDQAGRHSRVASAHPITSVVKYVVPFKMLIDAIVFLLFVLSNMKLGKPKSRSDDCKSPHDFRRSLWRILTRHTASQQSSRNILDGKRTRFDRFNYPRHFCQ